MACSWRFVTSEHKIDCSHFFALSGSFYKNAFFRFFDEESVLVTSACYVRAIGEKHNLGPAAHTVAARGLFDSTVPW